MGYRGSYLWALRQLVGHRLVLAPGAQVLILDDQQRAFFQRRQDMDIWEIPAGACEAGSSFRSTAVTEVAEETGLTIDPATLIPFASLSEPDVHTLTYPNGDVTHCFALCFEAREWEGSVALETEEVVEYGFFPVDSPPEPLHKATSVVLELYRIFRATVELTRFRGHLTVGASSPRTGSPHATRETTLPIRVPG